MPFKTLTPGGLNRSEMGKGFLAALLATASCVLLLTSIVSKGDAFDSINFLYQQNKLGALISLGALVNLLLFFVALRKGKNDFATGVLIQSMMLVVVIAFLKIKG